MPLPPKLGPYVFISTLILHLLLCSVAVVSAVPSSILFSSTDKLLSLKSADEWMNEWMRMEHWWNYTVSVNSEVQGENCPSVCILMTNLMHWLSFIHKILLSSTCFEPQVLIFRRMQLCTAVHRQATRNSHRESQYHMLHVYNCILLKMSTWGSKHVEENSILWINNNQCIKLVINI